MINDAGQPDYISSGSVIIKLADPKISSASVINFIFFFFSFF
jgi:hypothetical protein